MRWPNGSTSRPYISSSFGPRVSPGGVGSTYHRGVDFTGFSSVRAIAAGTVVVAGTPGTWTGGGRQVWVDHGGFISRYCHLASISVRVGQSVSEGKPLGVMGQTGAATGVHLHLEVRPGGMSYANSGQVDPVAFISARLGTSDTLAVQKFLNTLGLGLEEDGVQGPKTTGGIKWFQKHAGLVEDGEWGPNTDAVAKLVKAGKNHTSRSTKEIQTALRKANAFMDHWKIDDEWGNQTSFGVYIFQRKSGLEKDAQYGELTDAKLFKTNEGTDPEVGYNATDRPVKDIQKAVGMPASKIDNVYGPETTSYVKAWQKAEGLEADGIWGPKSDARAFPDEPTNELDPKAPWKSQTPDSELVTKWVGSPNYNNGSKPSAKKTGITMHWMAGTLAGTDSHFQNPGTIKNGRGTGTSTHYGIGLEAIHQYVKEQDYSHANGHADANATTITIEHEGGYVMKDGTLAPVAESTISLSAQLLADIAERHGWAKLVWMENVFPHNHWVATQCPGTLDINEIIRRANLILDPPDQADDKVLVSREWLEETRDYINAVL